MTGWATCLALGTALTGCTFLLDKETTQCTVDADCEKFSGHPSCQEGLCVASGLGPEGCVATKPVAQSDYLNACSTAKYAAFDNCGRLGLCGSSATSLPPAVDPSNPAIPPLINMVAMPAVSCSANLPPGGQVIYMFGAADFAPLLLAAQKSLHQDGQLFRAVFQNASSCAGVSSVFDPNKRLMTNPSMASTNPAYAFYYDDSGNPVNCLLDTSGNPVDIGVSDLYSPTCNPTFVPGGTVAEYTGPVVQFALSVPATSHEQSISAEAAHFIFGLGGKAPVGTAMKDASPWIDSTNYSIRNSGAASTVLTGLLADVLPGKFWGIDRLSTDNLRDSLLAAQDVNSSIGILSIDYNDKNRGNLRALYLQSKGQKVGYLPDSTPTTYDKANVRDGHYPLWGYVHFFTPLGPGGVPSATANAMVLKFRVQKLEQGLLDDIINASLVPQCAMEVARTKEMGDFSPQIGFRCGCYFDFKTTGKSSCAQCNTSDECAAKDPAHPACNYGFCEAN
jgi:hypothetical protein